mgnify:CR=1 FL=1
MIIKQRLFFPGFALVYTLYSMYKSINLLRLCRYILVYPQGCDVCNHLSLFLCVADYDKLLPGMSEPMHILDALPNLETDAKFNISV